MLQNKTYTGLTDTEVLESRKQNGVNILQGHLPLKRALTTQLNFQQTFSLTKWTL